MPKKPFPDTDASHVQNHWHGDWWRVNLSWWIQWDQPLLYVMPLFPMLQAKLWAVALIEWVKGVPLPPCLVTF